MVKNCNKCKVELSDENWRSCNKKVHNYTCNVCANIYRKKYRNGYRINEHRRKFSWATILKNTSTSGSRKKGFASTITTCKIISMFDSQNGLCHWTNIPMRISNKPKDLFQPSVDRLDCSKGYIDGNCVLSTMAANLARNNSSPEEFKEWINAIKSVK